MKEFIFKILVWIILNAIAYMLLSFVCVEFNPLEWHWAVRIIGAWIFVYITFFVVTLDD